MANHERLELLQRGLRQNEICPAWAEALGASSVPSEPLCVPACPSYEKIAPRRCAAGGHRLGPDHCRAALYALGLEILYGPAWPEGPEQIVRCLGDRHGARKLAQIAELLLARVREIGALDGDAPC